MPLLTQPLSNKYEARLALTNNALVQYLLRRSTLSVNARRFTKSNLESFGNLKHHTIREAWPKNRDCERHPILCKSSRTRDPYQIEDVGIVRKLKFSFKYQLIFVMIVCL